MRTIINIQQKITLVFLVAGVVFWVVLQILGSKVSFYNDVFAFVLNIIPLAGGLVAIRGSLRWKLKNSVGKGMFLAGLGIFLWSLGGIVWSYLNFSKGIATPYPSLADVFYLPSVFLYCTGTIYLAGAAGADFGLRHNLKSKCITAVLLVALLWLANHLILSGVRGHFIGETSFLENFLDIMYPLGDILSLCTAIVISGLYFKFLVREYRVAVSTLLVGLALMFIGDLYFSYATALGTHRNGGLNDLIFTVAMPLLVFGVLGFYNKDKDTDREKLHIFNFLQY